MKWNRFFLPSVGYGFPVGINFGGFPKQVLQTGRLNHRNLPSHGSGGRTLEIKG